MAQHTKHERAFLSLDDATEHQKKLKTIDDPYSEFYGLGVVKTMVELECGTLVTGWASKYEEYPRYRQW